MHTYVHDQMQVRVCVCVCVCVPRFHSTQDFGTPSSYGSANRHAQYKSREGEGTTNPLVRTGVVEHVSE